MLHTFVIIGILLTFIISYLRIISIDCFADASVDMIHIYNLGSKDTDAATRDTGTGTRGFSN